MDDDVPLGTWAIDPEVRASLRIDKVRRAADQGDWAEVALEAEELLDEQPDHPEALFLLGEALLELGQPEVAVEAYTQRARVGDEQPEVLLGLGIATYEVCEVERSIECLREVVRQVPDHAEAHFTLGLALEALGRDAAAAAAFQAAALLQPDAYPSPMQLQAAEWRTALKEAVASLDPEQQAVLDGVGVELLDRPDLDELRGHTPPLPPSIAAMLDGDPGDDPELVEHPTGLRVFTRVLARQPTYDDLVHALTQALHIETADWLGLDA